MSPIPKPCLGCGRPTRAGSRCPPCAKTHGTRAGYTYAEQRRRAEVVRQWRDLHGDVCPGWRRPAHPVVSPNVLTADHVHPVARGGAQTGQLTVLCRFCNGAKGAR